jgi:dethiobiotin synthetase
MTTEEAIDRRPVRVVVVGTGTGVGKTHLCVALLHALSLQGRTAVGLKPVESGLGDGQSDAERLAAVSMFHVKHPAPYGLPDPVSPHLAARRAGIEISTSVIADWVAHCTAPWTIVETAGGLLTPLAPGVTNLDLARTLAPDLLLLVGVDRLGVLHDVSACLLALRSGPGGLPEPMVILQAPEVEDRSSGTNADELVALGMVRQVAQVPRGAPSAVEVVEAMLVLLGHLQLRVPDRGFT